jgi:hypothetical protein
MSGSQFFALHSVVFMMGFVLVFDRMHWRHKYGWLATNLMTQGESQSLLRILAALQNEGDED